MAQHLSLSIYTSRISLEDVVYPKKIDGLFGLKNIKFAYGRGYPADKVYIVAKKIVMDFGGFVNDGITNDLYKYEFLFDSELTDQKEINKLVNNFKDSVKKTDEQILQIGQTLSSEIDKLLYLLVRRHSKIANIVMKHYDLSKISIDSIKDSFELLKKKDDAEIQRYSLGIFVALEPVLVSGALINDRFSNPEFVKKYEQLVNRFSRMVARLFPEDYIEETQLGKTDETQKVYAQLFNETSWGSVS